LWTANGIVEGRLELITKDVWLWG